MGNDEFEAEDNVGDLVEIVDQVLDIAFGLDQNGRGRGIDRGIGVEIGLQLLDEQTLRGGPNDDGEAERADSVELQKAI